MCRVGVVHLVLGCLWSCLVAKDQGLPGAARHGAGKRSDIGISRSAEAQLKSREQLESNAVCRRRRHARRTRDRLGGELVGGLQRVVDGLGDGLGKVREDLATVVGLTVLGWGCLVENGHLGMRTRCSVREELPHIIERACDVERASRLGRHAKLGKLLLLGPKLSGYFRNIDRLPCVGVGDRRVQLSIERSLFRRLETITAVANVFDPNQFDGCAFRKIRKVGGGLVENESPVAHMGIVVAYHVLASLIGSAAVSLGSMSCGDLLALAVQAFDVCPILVV